MDIPPPPRRRNLRNSHTRERAEIREIKAGGPKDAASGRVEPVAEVRERGPERWGEGVDVSAH